MRRLDRQALGDVRGMDCRRRLAARVSFALVLTALCSGCAWRSATAEHYFGPVLFRFNPGDGDESTTSQVVALGVLGEAGRAWGVSLGFVERITVVPRYMNGTTPEERTHPPHWLVAPGFLPPPVPGRWNLSPVYLRVAGMIPGPALIAQRMYGAQIVAGPDVRAASLGVVTFAQVTLPEDALSVVHYDSSAPLAARFSVWRAGPGHELPPLDVLKEAIP